jgi:hypothetical protein
LAPSLGQKLSKAGTRIMTSTPLEPETACRATRKPCERDQLGVLC